MSDDVIKGIAEQITNLGLPPAEQKQFLRNLVTSAWPDLPTFSTLTNGPVIEEVQKATVGTGVVPVFKENGILKAVVVKVGTHYEGPRYDADPDKPTYMIPGGFINLTETPGTALVPANAAKAEDPRTGAARELEEEVVDDKGAPVLTVDPNRLKPMDTKTITFPWGERRVVIGFMLELDAKEAGVMKEHVKRLAEDTDYRHGARKETINPETGKPEICTVSILPVAEILSGQHKLLHPDQKSLFQLINGQLSAQQSR